MISAVHIEGYRGIRDAWLRELAPLTVLVGPNSSGKTTVLEALVLGATPPAGDAFGPIFRARPNFPNAQRWFTWRGSTPSAWVEVQLDDGRHQVCEVQAGGVNRGAARQVRTNGASPADALHDSGSPIVGGNGGGQAPAATPSLLPTGATVRMYSPGADLQPQSLNQLYTAAVEQGRLAAIQQMVAAISGANDLRMLEPEPNQSQLYLVYPDCAVPLAVSGEGIRLLLQMALELSLTPGSLALMEEPEVHMHPGAVAMAAQVIWTAVRGGVQVVLSTHSLELLDALVAEAASDAELQMLSVFRLSLETGDLKLSRFAGPEVAEMRADIEKDLR